MRFVICSLSKALWTLKAVALLEQLVEASLTRPQAKVEIKGISLTDGAGASHESLE